MKILSSTISSFVLPGLQHVQNILRSPRATLKWIVCDNVNEARQLTSTFNLQTRCETPQNVEQALDDTRYDGKMLLGVLKTTSVVWNKMFFTFDKY